MLSTNLTQDTNTANQNPSRKDKHLLVRKKRETTRKKGKQKARKITITLMNSQKVVNSVGMKTKTSTNKTNKSLKKT